MYFVVLLHHILERSPPLLESACCLVGLLDAIQGDEGGDKLIAAYLDHGEHRHGSFRGTATDRGYVEGFAASMKLPLFHLVVVHQPRVSGGKA